MSRARRLLLAAACLVPLAVATPQNANAVTEPNGWIVPRINNEGGFEMPPNSGRLSLKGLFTVRMEMIDWQKDAATKPAVFSPLCGFTGTLVLRGGGCKLDFGWYNVPTDGKPPSDAELYTLVPNTDPIFNGAFAPQAGDVANTFKANDIRSNPKYKNGLIGFALRGNPAEYCKQTHYSQAELNQTCTTCNPKAPWVMAVVYKSTVTPNAFYLAFEDLSTSETQIDPGVSGPNGTFTNDGDFNDFVYFITGVTCDGGGKPCDTKMPGACSAGLTDCASDGSGICRAQVLPVKERCDNVDNDCNGMVDEGDLCPVGQVCDHGNCVEACGRGEFQCAVGQVCQNGFCIEMACKDVMCKAGEACRGGMCLGACDGVVCPTRQDCQLGRCIDHCAGVTCDMGSVCERGICVSPCSCRECETGKACDAAGSGTCVDKGCEGKNCGAGMACVAGACVDACQGVVCPGGAICAMGNCGEPVRGGNGADGGDNGGMSAGGLGNVGAGTGLGADDGGTGTDDPDASGGATFDRGAKVDAGCACTWAGRSGTGASAAVSGLLLALAYARRRRV